MEIASPSWFSELELEDSIFMDQCDIIDSIDEDFSIAFGDDFQNSPTLKSNSSSSTLIPKSSSTTTLCVSSSIDATKRPTKKNKHDEFNQSSSTPIILDFSGKSCVQEHGGVVNVDNDVFVEQNGLVRHEENSTPKGEKVTEKGRWHIRPPSQHYDHIIAERKRRDKLSQGFIALSAIVPGLKKVDKITHLTRDIFRPIWRRNIFSSAPRKAVMLFLYLIDKTSILGDAIKYMKQLQERVKTLEEQTAKKAIESMVLVKKSHLLIEEDGSSDETSPRSSNRSLPEIEVKLCDTSICLKIHCEKRKGVLMKIISNIENMNMSVANTCVSSFGTLALDITIIAEMEKECIMTVRDIVRSIRSTLLGIS